MTDNPDKARLLELIKEKFPSFDVENITSVRIDEDRKIIIGWNIRENGENLIFIPDEWISYD